MAILVTGGAGFIGSHLCEALLNKGEKVICVDNLNEYYPPERKIQNIASFRHHPNFLFFKVDITQQDELESIFQKHTIQKIVHLAARAGVRPSIHNPLLYTETNVKGTINLLEIARKYQIKQFVFGSSSSVYGNASKFPFEESDPIHAPISPYAASKRAAELYCYTYSALFSLPVTCLRFFTVYGPKGRPDMAPYIFTSRLLTNLPLDLYGDGTSGRDYTYVGDIVQGITAALERPFPFEIINLGNSNPILLKDLVKTMEEVTGKKALINLHPPQPGDVQHTCADISKAQRLLGYQPKTTLKEGLTSFVEWYQHEH